MRKYDYFSILDIGFLDFNIAYAFLLFSSDFFYVIFTAALIPLTYEMSLNLLDSTILSEIDVTINPSTFNIIVWKGRYIL